MTRLRCLVLLIALCCAACGSAPGGSSAGSTNDGVPGPPAPAGTPQALIGDGASYAAPDATFYLSSPESGPSWQLLSAARAAIWPDSTTLQTRQPGADLQVLLGTFISFPPGETSMHGYAPESAMWIGAHPLQSGGADLFVYGGVRDRTVAERWSTSRGHWQRAAPDGDFHVWTNPDESSALAISPTQSVWGPDEAQVRAAVDRFKEGSPSLADDPGFRSAMSRIDATGAAMIGFSRSNIASELDISGEGDSELDASSAAFGFHAMGFAVSGRPHGALVRGFPTAGVYTPVPPYRPQLLSLAPNDALVVADTTDVYRLFGPVMSFERALASADGEGSNDRLDPAEQLQHDFGLSSSQLDSLDHGEQVAWLAGRGLGFGVAAADPDAAESALRDAARHDAAANGQSPSVHREGSVVWVDAAGDALPTRADGGLRTAIEDARMPAHVSLVAYADSGLLGGFSDNPGKERYQRLLLWTLPRQRGWEWDLYIAASTLR